MNFDQSGLPPIQLVQDAFTHSYNHLMMTIPEAMKDFERQVTRAHRQNVGLLQQEKRAGKMSDEEFKQDLVELERMRDQHLKAGPAILKREMEKSFVTSHVNPAREFFRHVDNPAPEALAAIMLVECVRSPRDFAVIQKNFGPVVSEMLSTLIHAEAYSASRADTLATADDDVKRAYAAMTICVLEGIHAQAETFNKSNPGQRIVFPEGYEKQIFDSSKAIWKTDKKLDDRLLTAFNRTAEKVTSKVRFDTDASGDLIVVPFVPPTPPKKPNGNVPVIKPKPPGGGSIGGDVF